MWMILLMGFLWRDASSEVQVEWQKEADGRYSLAVASKSDELLQRWRSLPSEEFSEILQVFVAEEGTAGRSNRPSVLGAVSLQKNALQFSPKYPFVPGLKYEVRLKFSSDGDARVVGQLSMPKVGPRTKARVEAIFPSGDRLPQNLLRFYVTFSKPMAQGSVYRYIELSRSDGSRLKYPFLEVAEELWDPTGTRLTLLLDPARVKQGLVPREEDGPILEMGKTYRLTIRSDWPDADGESLDDVHVKTFQVTGDDLVQPDPTTWSIFPPQAEGDGPLVVDFPESLDHALAMRCLTVQNEAGETIDGSIELTQQERRWSMKPQSRKWKKGVYELHVRSILEDVAGNSIERPFEVHLNDVSTTIVGTTKKANIPLVRKFEIR